MSQFYSTKTTYNRLFYNLLIFMVVTPFLQYFDRFNIWFPIIFFSTIILAINTLGFSKKFIYIFRGIAIFAYLSSIISHLQMLNHIDTIEIFSDVLSALFMILSIVAIALRILSETEINGDVIKGAICIYLMIGILWGIFYKILVNINANSFELSIFIDASPQYQLFYFSFTTLTTLGYGDISPLNSVGMMLSNIEALLGQLFPAIFISKLVSLSLNK
ncbi:potassium channel family protein [Cyanobacterium aponinum UTEX 3221]|uniref:Ion transport 2 domain protein n=3 Tax=Cyanobacterium aponinum TaxID=379064 RepID=K9Z5K6_CYAAP|nr:potassium channel family protein [Cyanobacterium aponinum]AFZ54429.1 Ion transport 2 domain protein [Cyanobacterium aponinum PCC 10605]MTF38802.1 two pore domain potassium channel family protein [Cyanobacterium aponinum 0216]PHV62579.1 two pore domain potassium channel family protein [Cyanobacterium aponinum IPPAS B-1201]WRL37270.1 potassium channel family protein [Cyanobacterium aponinum UTEX 3221]